MDDGENNAHKSSALPLLATSGRYKPIASWWHVSYLVDYIVGGIVIVLAYALPVAYNHPDTFIPNFTDNPHNLTVEQLLAANTEIAYPHSAAQEISLFWAVFLTVVPILLLSAIISFKQKSAHDFHAVCVSLYCGAGLFLLFVNILKQYVGRIRPDFLDRCMPELTEDGQFICTGDPAVVNDGYSSYPSGQAAIIFYGMTFLVLYLSAKLHMFSQNNRPYWKLVVVSLPFLLAAFVALSRSRDYAHHVEDLNAAAFIGGAIGYNVYYLNFPNLSDPKCSIPLNRNGALGEHLEDISLKNQKYTP